MARDDAASVPVFQSLACATITGVPQVVGLYAAAPALVLYAAIGSSRHFVDGPMSGKAALSASIIGGVLRRVGATHMWRQPRRSPSSSGCKRSSPASAGWVLCLRSSPSRY